MRKRRLNPGEQLPLRYRETYGNITIEGRRPRLRPLPVPLVFIEINGWLRAHVHWDTLESLREQAERAAREPVHSIKVVVT